MILLPSPWSLGSAPMSLRRSCACSTCCGACMRTRAYERHRVSEFRVAFICATAASRDDARELGGELPSLDTQEIQNKLVPVLRRVQEPLAGDAEGLARHLDRALTGVAERLVRWSDAERAFFDALTDHGELKPDLLTSDPELRRRIAAQPMLRWKQKNVRQHRGLPPIRGEDP